jgi:hypothetical protein
MFNRSSEKANRDRAENPGQHIAANKVLMQKKKGRLHFRGE